MDVNGNTVAGVVVNATGEFIDLAGVAPASEDNFATIAVSDAQGVIVPDAGRLYWTRVESGTDNDDPYATLVASASLDGGPVDVVAEPHLSSAVDGLQVSGPFVSTMEIHAVPGGDEVLVMDRTLSSPMAPVMCTAPPTPLVTVDWVYDLDAEALTANCRSLDTAVPGIILGMESAEQWVTLQGATLLRQTPGDDVGTPVLPDSARELRWVVMSPDASRIAFTAVDPEGELSLWIHSLADGSPTRLHLPAEVVGSNLTLNDWTGG